MKYSTGNPIFGGSTSTIPLVSSERRLRDLLADAASLLKDKLTPDTGQLRSQWDRDVDKWLIAAMPLFEAEYAGLSHIITCHACGRLLGYSDVMTEAMDGAICGNCAVTRPERAAPLMEEEEER